MLGMSVGGKMFVFSRFIIDPQFLMFLERFYSCSATGISRDGGSIVGYSFDGISTDAFVWTQSGGMRALRGFAEEHAHAFGVNANGSVVVGEADFVGGNSGAVAWVNESIVSLGTPAGTGYSIAVAANDDGSVIVGNCSLANGQYRAMVWTANTGSVLLSDYVSGFGVSLPTGWRLFQATSVSADGRTIGGFGNLGHGGLEGFVVTVPCPPTFSALTIGALAFCVRRRSPVVSC